MITLYLLISSEQLAKATSWVERAIGLMFSRVDWEHSMNLVSAFILNKSHFRVWRTQIGGADSVFPVRKNSAEL